jgi:putative NIF3 family GTP cyclohydrolase 1 type 2
MSLSPKDLTQLLLKHVPYKDSWTKEAYGPQNTRTIKGAINRALYCVTPTDAVVDHFNREKYDILLTHHPFVKGVPQWIAHTALDCTTGGLNDQWRDALGVKNAQHFDGNLGWHGEIEPTSLKDLIAKCNAFTGIPMIGEHHGHEHTINRVVICTGLGGMVERQAHATGADCYILGEASTHHSQSPFKARIEVGHTISEHGTGLNFFRKILAPHGVQVDGSNLDHDKYSGEVYNRPVYNWEFAEDSSDEDDGKWDYYAGQSGKVKPGAAYGAIPKPYAGPRKEVNWNPGDKAPSWKEHFAQDWGDEEKVEGAEPGLKPGQDPYPKGG